MDVFLRVDINIMAAILLSIIFLIARSSLDRKDCLNRAFLGASGIIILELIFETATCILNRRPESWTVPLSNLLHICLFSAAPLLTFYWLMIVKNLMKPVKQKKKCIRICTLIPVIINLAFVLLSPVFHLVFYIDNNHVYKRGPLFLASTIIIYGYFAVSFFYIIKYKNKVVDRDFHLLLVFNVLPVAGGLVQTIFYGPLLTWSSVAYALVLVFVFLQQRMIHIDDLTGSWSRETFQYYMSSRIKNEKDVKFGLVYVDIDELKMINDTYGHSEGDFAIKESVSCMRSLLQENEMIVRMGGDEFIIILNCEKQDEINQIIQKMENAMIEQNENIEKEYYISCSFGGSVFDPKECSLDEFLKRVDKMMYQNKKRKKG